MPKKPKLSIGIPAYGPQDALFWQPLADMIGHLNEYVEYKDLLVLGTSNTDINRNKLTQTFLESDSEWLWWIDADNPPAVDAIARLLAVGSELVSGLYYGGTVQGGEHDPIAYIRRPDGSYYPLDDVYQWERGEIVPVDAVGMGCFLTHRSVYENIEENFEMVQALNGWIFTLHKDDTSGIPDEYDAKKLHPYANKIKKGTYHLPVFKPTINLATFPHFQCQFTRTEDFVFCENVKRLGYSIQLDTSVEVAHVKSGMITGGDYRKGRGLTTDGSVEEVDHV